MGMIVKKSAGLRALLLGNGMMLIASIMTGTDFSVVKLVAPSAASGNQVSCISILGACALFWIVSLFCKCQPLRRQDAVRVLVGGGLLVWVFVILFNLALQLGNPVDVAVANTLTPVFIALISICFMHGRVGWVQGAGLAAGLASAMIVIIGSGSSDAVSSGKSGLVGVLLGLADTLGYAVYLVLMIKPLKRYNVISLLRWVFLAASVPSLFFVPGFFHAPIWHMGASPWLSMLYITVCPMFLAYILVNRSIVYIGSEITGLYDYFLPVVSVVSSLVLGVITRVSVLQIVAMVVVIIGMVLTILGKRRGEKRLKRAQKG